MSRLPGIIFAALLPDYIMIDIRSANPMIPGHGLRLVPRSLVDAAAQMPNTLVWVHFEENKEIVAVTKCEDR